MSTPVTIYYERRAVIFCTCGYQIAHALDDTATTPVPIPGDTVTCPRCRAEYVIDSEELL